jgi:MFS family permease
MPAAGLSGFEPPLAEEESSAVAAPAERTPSPRVFAWVVFALTLALLLSDYMSRQVLNAVFPLLKAEWQLSDTQLGSLSGIVALMVGVLTFPLSLLADRWGRVNSLTVMALLWSLATFACGLADGYGSMFAARFAVGVGEAAYGSVGIAVIVAIFPPYLRATLAGTFMSGGLFGSVLGMGFGGVIASRLGWRWSFWVMALFGIVLVVLYRLVVTERRLAPLRDGEAVMEPAQRRTPMRFRSLLPGLFSSTSVVCAYVGSGLQLMIMASLLAWLPSYLGRYYDMGPDRAGVTAALFVLVAGVGMVTCGMFTDRVSRSLPTRKLKVAIGYCVTSFCLLALAYLMPHGTLQLALIGGGMFLAAGTTGPAGAMVANLTHPSIHATAFATLTLANNLLGLAPGPIVTGMLADRVGLHGALQLVAFASLAAATAFVIAIRHYQADLARMRAATDATPPAAGGSSL